MTQQQAPFNPADPFGFVKAIDTGAIDNLTPAELATVSEILGKLK